MKSKITAFVNELILYDYILFGSAFALFIILIVIAIVLRRKRGLAIFLILLGFTTLFTLPSLGYVKMHETLFKNSVEITSEKKLQFTQAIVVKGLLKNESNFDFKECRVTVRVHRSSANKYRDFLYGFKTIQRTSIILEEIPKESGREFKTFVEPFTYSRPYNLSIGAKCK
jgi:hypothetical protein